ncbi:MAG: hypothetical protein JO061_14425 [Acidobacteriaceae bacterium]|nr:hypothetical protein [Acidobacteriaceae bacterium]
MAPALVRLLRFITLPVFQVVFSQSTPMSGQDPIRPYCPQTANLTGDHLTDHWYEGTIGPKHVRMFLEQDGQQMVGLYYDISDWKPILLAGHWESDGKVQIRESGANPHTTPLGRFNAQASSSGNMAGTWIENTENSGAPKSVSLNSTPQPACTGSGVWKKFINPKWHSPFLIRPPGASRWTTPTPPTVTP